MGRSSLGSYNLRLPSPLAGSSPHCFPQTTMNAFSLVPVTLGPFTLQSGQLYKIRVMSLLKPSMDKLNIKISDDSSGL